MLSLNQGLYGWPVSMNSATNNDEVEEIKPPKKKKGLWSRMRSSKRKKVSRTKMVESTDDTIKPVVNNTESGFSLEHYLSKLQEEWRFVQNKVIIEDLVLPLKDDTESGFSLEYYLSKLQEEWRFVQNKVINEDLVLPLKDDTESGFSLEHYLSKLQEEWRFVQNEVIIEDLVLPLKDDMEILQTKFKQVIFPGENSCMTACTSSTLSSELSSEESEGTESEISDHIPRTISNINCGIKRSENGPKQQILASHVKPESNRNKGLLSKGLGKSRPQTIFIDTRIRTIEKQKLRTRGPVSNCRNKSLPGVRMADADHKTKSQKSRH